ncbi:MAG: hypothetical protein WCA89_09845 [Terracidiphilus sp.]|jgi:Ca2+/Na+ antiporter
MRLNLRKNPLVTLPIATVFLAIAVIWPQITHSSSSMVQNWDDLLRGAVFGLAIGMILMAVNGMVIQRRCQRSQDATKTDSAPRP